MAFPVKPWMNGPAGLTPLAAAALQNLEERLSAYVDAQVAAVPPNVIADNTITNEKLIDALAVILGVTKATAKRRGVVSVGASQNMPVDTLASLATPHKISDVSLATDGALAINYRARWGITAIDTNQALFGLSIFIDNVQIQNFFLNGISGVESQFTRSGVIVPPESSAGAVISAPDMTTISDLGGFKFTSSTGGLTGSVPTTGMMIGGWLIIEADAGTYDVEVKWRRLSAATSAGTVQEGKLRVIAAGF